MFKYLFISLFLIPLFSYGQFVSVCDRTPQVKEAIMEKVSKISSEIECQDDDLLELIFTKIQILDLEDKRITSLKLGDFAGLSSLQILSLYNNSLENLPAGVFAGLSSLAILDLHNNSLENLPAGVFAGLSSLGQLWLNNNDLTNLPPNIFAGLSSLRLLSLDNNSLENLPPNIFEGLRLKILYLRENPLNEQSILYVKSYTEAMEARLKLKYEMKKERDEYDHRRSSSEGS